MNRRLRSALRSISLITGGSIVLLGIVVIFGWYTGNESLVQVLPTFVPMQYNTALGFVFCGLGLLFLAVQRPRFAAASGAFAILIGGLTLVEYATGVSLGIDELFMKHDITVKTSHPGRMAPNTAICFCLMGLSLVHEFVGHWRASRAWIAVVFSSLAFGLAVVALSGYFTELETAYGWGNLTRMAVHTSVGFITASIGILCFVWSGNVTERTWIPPWMPVPTGVAILTATICLWQALDSAATRISSQYAELSPLSNIATLMLIGGILLSFAVALAVYLALTSGQRAYDLNVANVSLVDEVKVRKKAEKELQQHRDSLEQQVIERTRDLEEASRNAQAANRAKSDFLSQMSHELRTPLNGILGYAQILQRDSQVASGQKKNVKAILNCGEHLLTLINDVLDLSKIEAGKLEVDLRPADLHELIHAVGDIVGERARSKGLEFDINVSAEVPRGIVTDAAKLRQILINLAGNAVKFTESGSVSINVSESPKSILQLEIVDSGVGMSPDELEVIFDAFRQVEAGKDAGGTGLGLSISKQLAEALGGELAVQSKLGEGSVFTTRIPLVETEYDEEGVLNKDDALQAELLRLAPGQKCRILVADDRETNRDVLKSLLETAGFDIFQAIDGQDALDLLRQTPDVDMVLMDVRMPRLNGIETLKQIRADNQLKSIKVMAVTASVFPEFRKQAIESGFDDFLGKPFQADELMRKLRKHLNLEFEATDIVPIQESAARETQTVPTTNAISRDMVDRLKQALKIKNLTAIKGLAAELIDDPTTIEIGQRILELASSFDFTQLTKLFNELENSGG